MKRKYREENPFTLHITQIQMETKYSCGKNHLKVNFLVLGTEYTLIQ
jgi:hypothetical protein